MADSTKVLVTGEPLPGARPIAVSREQVSRRLLVDRLTRRLVTLGGVLIIACILAIFFVIAAEVYPLVKKPMATQVGAISLKIDSAPLGVGVD
jgi:ABC-type uncharacterized transport system permease subunit